MATERQIAANRRNAAKSTGPRSAGGKQRSRGNAIRHGLFSLATGVSALEEIEALARTLAGEGADDTAIEHARSAAEADIEMNRARRAKLALIERVESFGSVEVPRYSPTNHAEVRWLTTLDKWSMTTLRGRPKQPKPEDLLDTMPRGASEHILEAMQGALPELEKLADYERRASRTAETERSGCSQV